MRPRDATTPARGQHGSRDVESCIISGPCPSERTASLTKEPSDKRRMGPGRLTVFSSTVAPVARLLLDDTGQVREHIGESGEGWCRSGHSSGNGPGWRALGPLRERQRPSHQTTGSD